MFGHLSVIYTPCCPCLHRVYHCVCTYLTTNTHTHTITLPVSVHMKCSPSPLPFPQKNTHSLTYVEVIKFDKRFVYLKNPRLDSSDLLIAQLVERQTTIHEVVGSSPTRRSKFSNLNLYNSPCVHAYGVFPLSLSQKHARKYARTHKHTPYTKRYLYS